MCVYVWQTIDLLQLPKQRYMKASFPNRQTLSKCRQTTQVQLEINLCENIGNSTNVQFCFHSADTKTTLYKCKKIQAWRTGESNKDRIKTDSLLYTAKVCRQSWRFLSPLPTSILKQAFFSASDQEFFSFFPIGLLHTQPHWQAVK